MIYRTFPAFLAIFCLQVSQSVVPKNCDFRNLTHAFCTGFNHSTHPATNSLLKSLVIKGTESAGALRQSDMNQYPSLQQLTLQINKWSTELPWHKFSRRPTITNQTVHNYKYKSHSLDTLTIVTTRDLCTLSNLWLRRAVQHKNRRYSIAIEALNVSNSRGLLLYLPFSPWKYLLLPKNIVIKPQPTTPCSLPAVPKERMTMHFQTDNHSNSSLDAVFQPGDTVQIECTIDGQSLISNKKNYGLTFELHSMIDMDAHRVRYEIDNPTQNRATLTIHNVTVIENMWVSCEQSGPDYSVYPDVRALPIIITGAPSLVVRQYKSIDHNYHWCGLDFKAFPIPDEHNITLSYALNKPRNYTNNNFFHFKPVVSIGRIGMLFDYAHFFVSLEVRKSVGFEGVYTVTACNAHGCGEATCVMTWDKVPGMAPPNPHNFLRHNDNTKSWIMLKIVVLFCCTLLVIIFATIGFKIFAIKWKMRRAKLKSDMARMSNGTEMSPLNLEQLLLENTNYSGSIISKETIFPASGDRVPYVFPSNVVLYDARSLRMEAPLGSGAFGTVYLVKYCTLVDPSRAPREWGTRSVSEGTEQLMAAKKIDICSMEQMESFHREAGNLACLDHGNIVAFFGISMIGSTRAVFLLFEYMPGGDLRTFIQDRAPRDVLLVGMERRQVSPCISELPSPSTESSAPLVPNELTCNSDNKIPTPADYAKTLEPKQLNMSHLLNIAQQIASGLSYLAENKFVHRDLAARNCLVGEDLTIKISDFGMSRDLYCESYYKSEGSKLVPVRWLPPESILFGRFTPQSDVWSLGVVLWELFSYGQQPWPGLSNKEVIEQVKRGVILEQCCGCPDSVYECMFQCWYYEPEHRPNAHQILQYLLSLTATNSDVVTH